jgi:dTDP-4-dehydrorhamnose 3,5-epimerase
MEKNIMIANLINGGYTIHHAKGWMHPVPNDGTFPAYPMELKTHYDRRGSFTELYTSDKQKELFPLDSLRQVSLSKSKEGVFRGYHFQYDAPMNKLIRVVNGKARFTVINLNPASRYYQCFITYLLDNNWDTCLYVPWYCAVGFFTMHYDTQVLYFHDATHNPAGAVSINYKSIPFIAEHTPDPILSDKDRDAISLDDFEQSVLPLITFPK